MSQVIIMAYGLICQELERGDRSSFFASVQGSLAMYPIHDFGSEEQEGVLPIKMASGVGIALGLTEPDYGSNPGDMITGAEDGGDHYILNGAECGLQTEQLQIWPSSGQS